MIYSKIIGNGSYLPERILSNKELEQSIDTTDSWIRTRTGIKNRHIASDEQSTCDLAFQAASKALDSANLAANDIDLVIVATTTPDLIFPSTACLLQSRLGISSCIAFDVQAVCAGFIYAVAIADKFIKSGSNKNALIVGTDIMSRIVNWKERETCILFSDGAGAIIMQASKQPGVITTSLSANGSYRSLLQVPAGIGSPKHNKNPAYIQMKGSEVFRVAVETLGNIASETLRASNMSIADIDWLVPHQANIRIIKSTAKKLNLPLERVVITIDRHGNTSAASVPIALDFAIRDGRIKAGHNLLLEAFGGGFTWGAVLIKY